MKKIFNFIVSVKEEPVSYFQVIKNDKEDIEIKIENGIIPLEDFGKFKKNIIELINSDSLSNDFESFNNINFTITKRNIV